MLSDYKRTYLNFLRSLSQTQIVAIVAAELLNDFPKNLPRDLKKPITKNFLALALGLLKAIKQNENTRALWEEAVKQNENTRALLEEFEGDEPWNTDNVSEVNGKEAELEPNEKQEIEKLADSTAEKLFRYAIDLFLSADLDKPKENKSLDFSGTFTPISMYQAVAMHFAHLDAFLSDTLRVICASRPEVLRRDKKVSWATVLNFSDLQDVTTYFAEELVFEFGWKTIKERFKTLKEQFGLEFNISAEEETLLESFEQKRHLVIHNGGFINSRYVELTGSQTEKIGEPLAISLEDIESLYNAVKMSSSSIFAAVAYKYLGATEDQLTQVWMKSKNQPE